MNKVLGILGGMGPMATADLFIKVTALTRASTDKEHIRVIIDSNSSIPDRTAAILHGGEDPLPQMLSALRNLESCGADCVIMPCNTAHFFLPRLRELSSLPILDMTEIAARRGAELFPGKRPVILGTSGLLSAGIYDVSMRRFGLDPVIPNEGERETLMHLIYEVVKASLPMQPEAETWERLLSGLRDRGGEYFVLACTELPILAQSLPAPGPFLDPTWELAREAVLSCGYPLKE